MDPAIRLPDAAPSALLKAEACARGYALTDRRLRIDGADYWVSYDATLLAFDYSRGRASRTRPATRRQPIFRDRIS